MVGATGDVFTIISSRLPENDSEQHFYVKFQQHEVLQIKDITHSLTKTHNIN